MFEKIVKLLEDIEKQNNIKIIYAIESGSRGWGFASKDSDYDVRFIYVRPEDQYLTVFEHEDFIELPIDEVLDVNGWDLKKALKLLYKSNPPLLEWMTSPIIYKQEEEIVAKLRQLSNDFFSPVSTVYHYISLAKRTYQEIGLNTDIKLKKLFYILRPLMACKWIEENASMAPMHFESMITKLDIEISVLNEIQKLIAEKKISTEKDLIKVPENLMEYIKLQISHYDQYVKELKYEKNRKVEDLNKFFIDTVKEF